MTALLGEELRRTGHVRQQTQGTHSSQGLQTVLYRDCLLPLLLERLKANESLPKELPGGSSEGNGQEWLFDACDSSPPSSSNISIRKDNSRTWVWAIFHKHFQIY